MFGRRKQVTTRIDTLLGKTANLNGDLEFSGGLHLDGRVNGNVRSASPDGGALSVSAIDVSPPSDMPTSTKPPGASARAAASTVTAFSCGQYA